MGLIDLTGRVALVTGAGQGVGRQAALTLAGAGAEAVVVNDFYAERAQAVAGEVEAAGTRALAVAADVGDQPAVAAMVAEATAAFGRVDVLVNNAGNAGPSTSIFDVTPFWQSDPADWKPWIDVNFNGVLHATHAVLPGMVECGWGRIVTVISDAGRVGEPNMVVYSGAKAGAAGLTRAVAKAVGRHGITANCVALSAIETPATESELRDEATRKAMLRNYVIRRFGRPDDAAAIIAFLASDSASWITGQTYPVNGGYALAL